MCELDKRESNPPKNKAACSRINKKCVFTCIMAVYDIKDSVNMFKTLFTRVNTGKMKKNTGGYTWIMAFVCLIFGLEYVTSTQAQNTKIIENLVHFCFLYVKSKR